MFPTRPGQSFCMFQFCNLGETTKMVGKVGGGKWEEERCKERKECTQKEEKMGFNITAYKQNLGLSSINIISLSNIQK